MIFDVHNLYFKDAIDESIYKFDECPESGENTQHIIHGYKHGTIIKDYIRSNGFVLNMAKLGFELLKIHFSDKGVSIFN